MRNTLLSVLILSIVAACVPATLPPQLAFTPGPGVRVTDRVYDLGHFAVTYPPQWTVVTSAAGDPVHVIFAAPAGDALIELGEAVGTAPPPAGYNGPLQSETRSIRLDDGVSVRAILNAPPDKWALYEPVFESVMQSMRQ